MIKILSYSLISTVLILSGCGGGGGGASFTGKQGVPVVSCNSVNPSYITLQSGDTLVKQMDNTRLEIIHSQNGDKKVCVKSGAAMINR
jgi:hypothetical protein